MKVEELVGAKLDYWVAKAEGLQIELGQDGKFHGYIFRPDEDGNDDWYIYSPSTDWSQGGPIIEAADISIDTIQAGKDRKAASISGKFYVGPTCLIAAMRAFVASRFGVEVDDS